MCGFPATYDDPAKEASIAYPIGSDEFIQDFLEARKNSLQTIMKHTLRIATEASASLPILQSLNCLLRACVTQKVGYLVRITPPDTMAKFVEEIDEMLVDTVCELMQLEEVTPRNVNFFSSRYQKEGGDFPPSTRSRSALS